MTNPALPEDSTSRGSSGTASEEEMRRAAMEELEQKGRRGLFGKKGGKPTKGTKDPKGRADKKAKAPSAAQVRREKGKKARTMRMGVRYGGDRMKWLLLTGGIMLLALLSVASMMVALSRPSKDDIDASVDTALAESGRDFPTGQAVMWAGQVLRTWGTWDEANADARKLALSPYISSGMDPAVGWNGRGKQTVVYASVNPEPYVNGSNHATVDAVYQIQDGTWRCVGIPVYAFKPEEFSANAKWAFVLSGNPTPVPCTPRTGNPVTSGEDDPLTAGGMRANSDIGRTLATDFFPAFFAAWAASDEAALNQFTASGVRTIGLGGAMSSLPQPTIGDTMVYVGKDGPVDGTVYKALVPVTWTVAGTTSQVTSTYVVPIRRDGQRWTVAGEPEVATVGANSGGRSPAGIPEPGQGVVAPTYPEPEVTPSSPPATSNPRSTEPAKTPAPTDDSSATSSPDSDDQTSSPKPTGSDEEQTTENPETSPEPGTSASPTGSSTP